MTRTLHDLIAGTSELRSLPSTTSRLMELLDDLTVDAAEVLDVIEKDPSLTANLLKLANSAYYGLRRQVGTAREALIMLGNQTLVNLAFATSMGDVLRGPLAAYRLDRNQLWHHALGTALAAAHLASLRGGHQQRERAFTGGLVHDIGKLILDRPLREQLVQLPPDARGEALSAAERAILGFDHAEAGAALAETWNFPAALAEVIRLHHRPLAAAADGDLVRAVAAANRVTVHLGLGGGEAACEEAEFAAAMEELGFPPEPVAELLARLPADLESLLGLLGDTLA